MGTWETIIRILGLLPRYVRKGKRFTGRSNSDFAVVMSKPGVGFEYFFDATLRHAMQQTSVVMHISPPYMPAHFV